MANLETIKSLNLKYKKVSPITKATESFDLVKGMDYPGVLNQDRLVKAFAHSLAEMGRQYVKYFDHGLPSEVALLYIDVCFFSTRFSHLNGSEIGDYFDQYYERVIPIIYEYGGEIDKIMGDGIICSFGPPFLDYDIKYCTSKAGDCARKIIQTTAGTRFETKVAFHTGNINYFKNKSGFYNEYTMVGKPLTELFRLESVTDNNSISFYSGTEAEDDQMVNILIEGLYKQIGHRSTLDWKYEKKKIENLRGVDFTEYYIMKVNK